MKTTTILQALSLESKSSPSIVTSAELKEVLDNYVHAKQGCCFSSASSHIIKLRSFSDGLNSNYLSAAQVISLAKLLTDIERDNVASRKTFWASEKLRNKLRIFIQCTYFGLNRVLSAEMVAKVMEHPDTLKKLNGICTSDYFCRGYLEEEVVCAFINDPTMLDNILKVGLNSHPPIPTDFILIYQLLRDSSYLEKICHIMGRLRDMDAKIYMAVNCLDKRINNEYRSRINSEDNIKFFCKFAGDAEVLADVFILLHQNKIGLAEINQIEMRIRSVDQKTGEDASKGFESLKNAFQTLEKNHLFTHIHADLIFLMCEPKNHRFAENIANAMVEFKKYDRLNEDNKNMIKQCCLGTVYAVSQTFNILQNAKLVDLENRVHIAKDEMPEALPLILKTLDEARPCLLSRENASRVFDILPTAPLLYARLPQPITQDGFISALSEIKEEKRASPFS